MHLVDQRLQAVRKFSVIHIPVAQPGVIVFALAKPAIVHHKSIHAQRRGLLRQRHLPRLAHFELGRLPRVVDNRPRLRRSLPRRFQHVRQNMLKLKMMQQPRSAAQPVRRVPSIKHRRLQRFARLQHISKIKWIESAGDSHCVQLVLLHRDPP